MGYSGDLSASFNRVLTRLSARQGVIGVIICDSEGFTLDSNISPEQSEFISAHVNEIISRVNDVTKAAERLSIGGLTAISIELETKELYIVPDKAGFTIVILREN